MSSIIGKKIVVLTAHPDDESFLAAGTIYANNQAGGQTVLVCATFGEKGASHLPAPISEAELGRLREQELRAAAKVVGITEVRLLGYPDGKVDSMRTQLFAVTAEVIEQVKPELLLSFGPDGVTGHNDHIAVSEVARQLSQQYNLPLAQCCIPLLVANEMLEWLRKRRRANHYQDDIEVTQANITIPVDKNIKLQALLCHTSQIDQQNPFEGFPDHIAQILATEENFCITKL